MLNLSNKQFKVGMYIRLSREDGDKQESESIGNQRKIIKRFLEENELNLVDEYVDDGVSGTTFEREGFNRLIGDIENKRIDMVVTKDLSRLGRDYIKTGYYLENYFPEKQVRYIAILDGIDTYLDSTNNDISPFKAIMNDMYAKDISKKIRSVFREKQKCGQFLGSIPPYGYKFSSKEKGKLEVDPYAAEVVREIFQMYSEGHGSNTIKDYLNNKGILSPSNYNQTTYKNQPSKEWNQTTILAILKSQVYIGNTVQNKKTKISYKSKKIINTPKENWIIVEDTHEGIIDKDLFEKVRLILDKRDTTKCTKYEYLFKGMLKCHHCGRKLQIALKGSGRNGRAGTIPYINCMGHEKRGRHPISMNYWKFEESVLEVIKNICKIYLDENVFVETFKEYKSGYCDLLEKYQKKLNELQTSIKNVEANMDNMYMDKLSGIISTDAYIRLYTKFNEEKKELIDKEQDIKLKIKTVKEKEEENVSRDDIKAIINEFLNMKEASKYLMYKLINYIEMDTNKNIYIHFNFNHLNIISDSLSINNGIVDYDRLLKAV